MHGFFASSENLILSFCGKLAFSSFIPSDIPALRKKHCPLQKFQEPVRISVFGIAGDWRSSTSRICP